MAEEEQLPAGVALPPVPDSNASAHPAELRTSAARAEFLEAASAPPELRQQLASFIARPLPEQAAAFAAGKEAAFAAAADAIRAADLLLVATGAGFSADSGLPTYVDCARLPPYLSRGLSYRDLCVPDWLHRDKARLLASFFPFFSPPDGRLTSVFYF